MTDLPESNVEPQEPVDDRITLSDVATSEALRPLIKDDEAELSPHLPPTNEPIETAVSTPQFQQVRPITLSTSIQFNFRQ